MLGQMRGYFSAKTVGQSIFMQDQNSPRLFDASLNGFLIPGLQAAQVDDLNGQIRVFFNILQRPMYPKPVSNDAGLRTLLHYTGFAYFNGIFIIRYLFADAAVQVFMLE